MGGPALDSWHGVAADSLGHVIRLDLTRNGLSGRLPRTMGQMAQLGEVRIGGNPELSGRLPTSLVGLPLSALHYPGTGLCAPDDEAFQEWLRAIPSHEGSGAECPELSDREVLEAVYDVTGGPDWTRRDNWLTEAPLGDWQGVGTDSDGRVIELSLRGNNLRGSIPTELGSLSNLKLLYLARNGLTGPIPAALGNLTGLQALDLNENHLDGQVPAELANLAELLYLQLAGDNLTGPIPAALGSLTNLRRLHLARNAFTGPLPSELSDLSRLERLTWATMTWTDRYPRRLGA